jgi:hypothetical protein
MRRLRSVLLLLALLLPALQVFGAQRTPFQARCEDTIAKTVSVLSAKQNGYSINTQLSYKSLTAMKGQAVANSYVLGLTRTESTVQIGANGPMLQDRGSGYECISPQIVVELSYAPVKIYIGSEFPKGTCGYDVILEHEMRHLKTYMDHLPRVENTVRAALAKRFGGKPFYAPSGTAQSALSHEINTGWLSFIKAEMAKVETLQAAIDTPAEYARLGKLCNGEIQKVLNKTRRPGGR